VVAKELAHDVIQVSLLLTLWKERLITISIFIYQA
jgi:hypothetical protein